MPNFGLAPYSDSAAWSPNIPSSLTCFLTLEKLILPVRPWIHTSPEFTCSAIARDSLALAGQPNGFCPVRIGCQFTNISSEATGVKVQDLKESVILVGRPQFWLLGSLSQDKWLYRGAIQMKVIMGYFKEEEDEGWTLKPTWVWKGLSNSPFSPLVISNSGTTGLSVPGVGICRVQSQVNRNGSGRLSYSLSGWIISATEIFPQVVGQMGNSLKGKDAHMWATLGSF